MKHKSKYSDEQILSFKKSIFISWCKNLYFGFLQYALFLVSIHLISILEEDLHIFFQYLMVDECKHNFNFI